MCASVLKYGYGSVPSLNSKPDIIKSHSRDEIPFYNPLIKKYYKVI